MATIIRTGSLDHLDAERVLMATLVPRPVVWVTTLDYQRSKWPTLAPFTAVTPICNAPPLILLAVQRREDGTQKRTAANILATSQFVLNVIDDNLIEGAVRAADPQVVASQRFACAGVTPVKSEIVKPPRIAECEVSLECRLRTHQELGEERGRVDIFIGEILCVCLNERAPSETLGSQVGTFCGVGAMGLEWYLTRSGIRRIQQPYAQSGPPLPPPLLSGDANRK